MRSNQLPLWLALVAILLAPTAVAQRSGSASASTRYAGDTYLAMVDLRVGREEVAVRYEDDGAVRDIDTGYLLIDFMGEIAPHTLGGIRLGHVSPSPDDRLSVQGINLHGYSLGFGFDGRYPLLRENVFLLAALYYQYVDADGSSDDQTTDYEWWTLDARLGAALRVSRVELRGGAIYRSVEGEENTFGDVDSTTDFEIDREDAAFFELDFNTDPGGHIGVTVEDGGTDRVQFYFRRFF